MTQSGNPTGFQCLVHPLQYLGDCQIEVAEGKRNLFLHGRRHKAGLRVLTDIGKVNAPICRAITTNSDGRVGVIVVVIKCNASLFQLAFAQEDPEKGGFPRSVRSDKREPLPDRKVKGDILQLERMRIAWYPSRYRGC